MRGFVKLSLIFALVIAVSGEEVSQLIFGGVNAFPGEFPYLVSVQHFFLGDHICGGAILSPIWILTCAHCLTETSTRGSIEVLAGRHNLRITEEFQQRVVIERNRWLIHPGWTSGRNFGPNDIALALLASPLTFNNHVRAIRLPQQDSIPIGPGTFAGWGATSNGIGSGPVNLLQKVMFSTIANEVCVDAVSSVNRDGALVDDQKFCTGPLTGGFSTCQGDFGGPLAQGTAPNEVAIGIASWGITPCGVRGAPTGIFIRVSHYVNWITANTGVRP